MVGEQAGGVASVEEYLLGGGHEFMHEREHENMLAILGSATMAQSIVEVAGNSVETSRGGV